MKTSLMIAALLTASVSAGAASPAASGATPTAGCHASFSVADAKTLAAATPNARAFIDNFGATLETSVHSQTATTANIAVTATDSAHGTTQVGIYTVSLRTGHVTDDDMEPAEDDGTAALRNKLLIHHCTAK